mgnify:CR=1 FL=1|tara:strand:- start:1833 stop:2252 length:420 start_codon:yes stop_codon:yes gene_type:complete
MNLDKLFELFTESKEDEFDSIAIDFKNSPIYWIGMYKKLILNTPKFNEKIVKFFKESNKELDAEEMSEAGEWLTYQRAWNYIQYINPEDDLHIRAIKNYSDEHLDVSLKLGIKYFEDKEIYEKCALLKKILDKSLESSL